MTVTETGATEYQVAPAPNAPGIGAGTRYAAVFGTTAPTLSVVACTVVAVLISSVLVPGIPKFAVIVLELAAGLTLNLVSYPHPIHGNLDPKLADALPLLWNWHKRPKDYTSDANTAGIDTATGTPNIAPPPPEVGNVEWIDHRPGNRSIGITRHRTTGRLTALLQVQPKGMGLAGDKDMDRVAEALNTVQHTFAHGGFAMMLVNMVMVGPTSDEPRNKWDQRPSRPGTPETIDSAHETMLAEIDKTPTYRSFWGVIVEETADVVKAANLRSKGDAGIAALVTEELDALAEGLTEAGYRVLGPVSLPALVAMTRNAYDPAFPMLPHDSDEPLDPRRAWPLHRSEPTTSHVESDGWFISAHEVTLPRDAVTAGFDARFITSNPDVRRTHVVLRRLIPTDKALTKAERRSRVKTAVEDDAAEKNEDHGEKSRHETAVAVRQTKQLARKGDVGVALVEYVIVKAPTAESLEDGERRLRRSSPRRHLAALHKDHHRGITYGLALGQGLR